MTDLLHFPDDETKAFRRARAEALARAARDARIAAGWGERLDDLMAAKPDGQGATPALDLARWLTNVAALLNDIKREPAPIRMEAGVTARCLKLKGLVDEAELQGFIEVTACEPPALDMARQVNEDLIDRARSFGRDRKGPIVLLESTPGTGEGWLRERFLNARRAPGAPAAPASGLIVRDTHSGGPSSSPAGSAAGPALSPQEAGAGSAVAGSIGGRSVGTEPVLGIAEGDTRGLRPSRLLGVVNSLVHAARMRLAGLFVTEKRNGPFSDGTPGGRT
ncbi:hypothetical protein [Hoeflea sp.]|uniref:hypothetical protein n=1 Tax=Hoeflea sp. TaxID=1940281 RepID=UPI0019A5136E|nr:hypothetical protein [Hoeflea sp.]MBC7282644.1 hypothetical protein [Hoeflea sp.]